ncbi:MAG: hypothetical protein PeribacterA2_0700 [Candidatus Peribacter riflensis]|uniref:Uncharacterized protein n=1 Tax=Candidatus Peribacter riflensis TaxID=1735162 RepID=A0A0S1SNS8_9BACT|nr:MAG: hypothetical protein PeribacterA2_0700 [Candidatus Peribacter riflensis]ALM11170.1 MAG: hypothetical protein PeribacterB2_0701 [Candidatus Peribacter riflensis]ALM12273.1 MAG: hypothetical protein PeribacterC2_0701 [Candidatus Peribacter riflensis]ALM13375.1 MAG: hypothetical protein PeribacterD1_0701 [Candidatus Peribacter riflensis]ALM14476.1 MAG: hypothetical protein PeribacterD2_0701 [Candidatus Peribacter riflensis]
MFRFTCSLQRDQSAFQNIRVASLLCGACLQAVEIQGEGLRTCGGGGQQNRTEHCTEEVEPVGDVSMRQSSYCSTQKAF